MFVANNTTTTWFDACIKIVLLESTSWQVDLRCFPPMPPRYLALYSFIKDSFDRIRAEHTQNPFSMSMKKRAMILVVNVITFPICSKQFISSIVVVALALPRPP